MWLRLQVKNPFKRLEKLIMATTTTGAAILSEVQSQGAKLDTLLTTNQTISADLKQLADDFNAKIQQNGSITAEEAQAIADALGVNAQKLDAANAAATQLDADVKTDDPGPATGAAAGS